MSVGRVLSAERSIHTHGFSEHRGHTCTSSGTPRILPNYLGRAGSAKEIKVPDSDVSRAKWYGDHM